MTETESANGPGPEVEIEAEEVVDRFGGIRPLANRLEIAGSTVQGWKARNHIPDNRWDDVIAAARSDGISLKRDTDKSNIEKHEETATQEADSPVGKESTETMVNNSDASTGDKGPENEAPKSSVPNASAKPDSAATKPKDEKPAAASGATKTSAAKAAPAKPAAAPAPKPAPSRGASGIAWIALLLSLCVIGAEATRPYWQPTVGPALANHLERFFGKPVAQQQDSEALDALKAELAAATARIEPLEARLAEAEAQAASALAAAEANGDISQLVEPTLTPVLDRIAAVEDRLSVMGTGAGDDAALSGDVTSLNEALTALRTRLEAAVTRTDGSVDAFRTELDSFADQRSAIQLGLDGVTEQLSALQGRLSLIEESGGGPGAEETALVLIVGQVETDLTAGRGIDNSLGDLAALTPNSEEAQANIEALRGLGTAPIMTRSDLSKGFADIAAKVDRAEHLGGAESWVAETLAELRGLVSIRRVGTDPEAPVASQAEGALAEGDLEKAISVVKPLADIDPDVAAWVGQAERRLTADNALNGLRETALQRLQAASTGG